MIQNIKKGGGVMGEPNFKEHSVHKAFMDAPYDGRTFSICSWPRMQGQVWADKHIQTLRDVSDPQQFKREYQCTFEQEGE
jgi:hypothetical protein